MNSVSEGHRRQDRRVGPRIEDCSLFGSRQVCKATMVHGADSALPMLEGSCSLVVIREEQIVNSLIRVWRKLQAGSAVTRLCCGISMLDDYYFGSFF